MYLVAVAISLKAIKTSVASRSVVESDREEVWDNFAQADKHKEYRLATAYLEVKLEGKVRHCSSVLWHRPPCFGPYYL